MNWFGPQLNYTYELYNELHIPGPRINPKFVNFEGIKEDPNNMLFVEFDRSLKIYNQIVEMARVGHIKKGHRVEWKRPDN